MSIHLEGPSLLLSSYDFTDQFGGHLRHDYGQDLELSEDNDGQARRQLYRNGRQRGRREVPATSSSTFMASRGASSSARLRRE